MRIIIVDDHPLVRKGLSSILSIEDDIELIGECTEVTEAINLINIKQPDIVLVDLRLGKNSGLEIINKIKKQNSNIKFIILTSSASYDDFIMSEKSGVNGYVLKEAFPEELLYAIRIVYRGRKYYDPELVAYKKQHDEHNIYEQLTDREFDVLKALSKGLSNKQIAEELFITENTVKKHISQILAKLNLQDRTQAAIYAINLEPDLAKYS